MRIIDTYLRYVKINDKVYKVSSLNGRDLNSIVVSKRPSKVDIFDYYYWPETMDEFHVLIQNLSGLELTYDTKAGCTVWGNGPTRLIIENRMYAKSTGLQWCEYGREDVFPETSNGFWFGYKWTDGAKWYVSPPIRNQPANKVVIPSNWMTALKERYGFYVR